MSGAILLLQDDASLTPDVQTCLCVIIRDFLHKLLASSHTSAMTQGFVCSKLRPLIVACMLPVIILMSVCYVFVKVWAHSQTRACC